MIKRRHRATDEIMLIPFLDILCSLIGVLILIIVVLCVAQTQKINGRTKEEIQRAQDHQKLLKQQPDLERISSALKLKVEELEKLRKETAAKDEQVAKIRKLLTTSAADREKVQAMNQALLKELDNLMIEIGGLNTQEAPLKKDIAALLEEIKKKQPPPVKGPSVIVQPGGSGLAKGTKVFFIEASGGKLTAYWDEKTKTVVSAVADVVATDAAFNAYLKAVQTVPQSKIIFLLRDDGMGAFNLGAGWAQATYAYRVDQVGKLPIPGRGDIDLRMFKDFMAPLPVQPPAPEPKPDAPPKPPVPAPPQPPAPAKN